MRFLPNGKPLILNGKPSHAPNCCCRCCTNLPETLYLTIDQFVIEEFHPIVDCDPWFFCEDGEFAISGIPGAPTGQPDSEIAFSTGPCTDDNPGAGNGSPVSVAALKIRCREYADGISRWYVHSIGGVPLLSGHYNDCNGGTEGIGWRKCVLSLSRWIFDPHEFVGIGQCPQLPDYPGWVCNPIGPSQSCSPFLLQGTARLGAWATPDHHIFVDRCHRNVSMRFTVTE